ncbi:MAG: sugar-binding protein [Verrucomicrobiae bacterium]|nr:sugar-binding protein [Verrucomicrobiae bacterium]
MKSVMGLYKTIVLVFWLLAIRQARMAVAEDYYFNDFEDKDDVSFWGCGYPGFWDSAAEAQKQKLMTVHFKGIASVFQGEKAYSGVRSFKLDLTLNGQPATPGGQSYKWNYWRGPKIRVALDQPVYLSGYVYPEKVPPDVEVALGWSIMGANREGKFAQSGMSIKEMWKVENGWIFFQMDLREALRKANFESDAYLDNWYLHVGGNVPFHGQRVVFYFDDVRVSSTKVACGTLNKDMARSEVLTNDPYVVNYTSFFKERPFNPHNVVDNGSFELGLKNWQVSSCDNAGCVWQVDDKMAFHGRRSLKIFCPNGGASTVNLISQLMPVEAGQTYTFSLYARSDESTKVDVVGRLFVLTNAWQRCVVPIQSMRGSKSDSSPLADLYSISINLTGKGSVWIDAVQLEKGVLTDYRLPDSTELGIYCKKPGNIYHAGEPVSFEVNVFNAATNEVSAEIKYSIMDFERKVVRRDKKKILLPTGQGDSHTVETLLPPGYYKILAELKGKALPQKAAELSMGVIVPIDNAIVGVDSFFGVTGFCPETPNFNLARRFFAKESGVKYSMVYNFLYWCQAPKNWREHNEQWKRADRLLPVFEQSGVTPVIGLWGAPPWSGISNSIPNKLEEVTDEVVQGWYDYTYEVVRRYKDRCKHWLIWGEFMNDPLEERAAMYIKFVKAASKAIRTADPTAVIIGFAEDGACQWGLISQLEEHFKLGSLDYVDVVGLDAYAEPGSPEGVDFGGMLEKLKQVIRKYNREKDKDIWITEVGWKGLDTLYSDLPHAGVSYVGIVSELAQAENLVRANLISLARGAKRFCSFDTGTRNITYFMPYNLMNYAASSPKTAFVAYNHMVNRMANAKFEREIKIGGKIICYQFKKDNRSVIAIWNYDDSRMPIKIKGQFNMSGVNAYNMVGTPIDLPKDGLLTLTGSPLYFEISGKMAEKLAKVFEKARIEQVTMMLKWGEKDHLQVLLWNGTSGMIHPQIVVSAPANWQMTAGGQTCVLEPDEQKVLSFAFDKIQFDPDKDLLKVVATTEEGALMAEWRPLPCVYVASAPTVGGDFAEWCKGMPINLGATHRRSVALDNSIFQGKNELNATVYTQWDEECFYLGVEVYDNIFAAPYAGGKMVWANDALQIAFDTLNDAVGKDNYDNNDYEYVVSMTVSGKVEVWRLVGGKEIGVVKDVRASVKKEQGKLCYEIAFPWSTLVPMDPKTRRDMGFNLTIMDNDGDEKRFPKWRGFHQYLQITEGICEAKNPAKFKDLILLKK